MPATTNNDTLLKAFNQAIQALLDLNIGGGGDCPDVTVNLPAPVVNVYNTVKCGGCGGGGGSTPPQTPGEEGGTPPPGTGTPDPIDDRKCKVAHILIHELIAYTDNMAALGLFDFTLDYSSLGGILNSLANGFSSGLLSLVFQVGGWLQNLQNLIFFGGFGASIPETLSANQDDMICALYNATNVSDAKADVVAASGLTGQDAEYLRVILTTEALNMLFFSIPGSEGVIFNYQGAADCGGCDDDSEGYTWDFSINSNGGTKPNQEAWINSVNGRANSYDDGGHWWSRYGDWTTFILIPGKTLQIPAGTIVKIWWENAIGSAQGDLEQFEVSPPYGYFPGPCYGGSSPSEVVINRDWTSPHILLTPKLGGLRITKIVIVGVH